MDTRRRTAETAAQDNESDTESIEAVYIANGHRWPSPSSVKRTSTRRRFKRSRSGDTFRSFQTETEIAAVPLSIRTDSKEVYKAATELVMLSRNLTELERSWGDSFDRRSRELELAPKEMQENTSPSFKTQEDGTCWIRNTGKSTKRSLQRVIKTPAVPLSVRTEDKEVYKAATELVMLSRNLTELERSWGDWFDRRSRELELAPEEMQENTSTSFKTQEDGTCWIRNTGKSSNRSSQRVIKTPVVPLSIRTEDKEVYKAATELVMLSRNLTELERSWGDWFDQRNRTRKTELAPKKMQENTPTSLKHQLEGKYWLGKTGKRSNRSSQRVTKTAAVPLINPADPEDMNVVEEVNVTLASAACILNGSKWKLLNARSSELELVPKEIQTKATSETEGDELENQQEGNEEIIEGNRTHNTSKGHVCTVCGRAFSSWQALTGHKRSHYKKEKAVPVGVPIGFVRRLGATYLPFLNKQPGAASLAEHHVGTGRGQGETFEESKVLQEPRLCQDQGNYSHRCNMESRPASEDFIQPAAQAKPVDTPLDLNL